MNPVSEVSITLKLNAEQQEWIANTARFIESETGCKVSHASILLRLMEHGLPQFEKDMQQLRAKANAETKRFPRLQLIYTQHQRPAPGR
jgi:hypothetical protein